MKNREWPVKSELNKSIRLSKKGTGRTRCIYCDNYINEGEVTFLLNPVNEVSGVRLHVNCVANLNRELNKMKRKNIKKLLVEQLCPNIKTADEVEE